MSGSARTFRVGLVGCGRISKNHLDAIARVNGLELAAVCDIDRARADAAGQAHGVPAFTSMPDLFANAEVDVVTICTPSGLHAAQGAAAARAGKHVVTEKPMALSLSQADDLVQA